MSVAIANSSMPLDQNEQLYNELTAAFPVIPSHVVYAVIHQFPGNKYKCYDALKRTISSYDVQPPNQMQQNDPGGIRPRSDSAGSVSSNSSTSENQMRSNMQPSSRQGYSAESRHYNPGYPPHFSGNDLPLKNLTIEEERQSHEPPVAQHGGWVESPHQSRKRYPSGYQANPHLPSPSPQRHFDSNWMSSQSNHPPSRPQTFAQSFPDKNGDLSRDSPNTPSPGFQQAQQPSYRGTPPTPPSSSHSAYMYGIPEPVYERQGSGYPPHMMQGQLGYPVQLPTSQAQNLQNQNYTSSIFVPMAPHDPNMQSYRTPSPSQEFRNNPQTLPVYRTAYQPQASSDSSPGTPGHNKATTPGGHFSHMVPQASMSGTISHTPPGQIASPGQYMHPSAAGMATPPGQYNPSSQYPGYQPNMYGFPGPHPHTAMRTPTYVNQPPPQGAYQQSLGVHQGIQNPPFVFQGGEWPDAAAHGVSPTDGLNFQAPPSRQVSSSNEGCYRRNSAGEDSAYITTLLEHQKKRKAKLDEDLKHSFNVLNSLKADVSKLQRDLQDRRRTRTHFTATAEDVQKMKQENKKLQIDIHLLTMRIDAAAGDNSQLRLGVLDIPHRDNFYSNIPRGQQVIPSEQQQPQLPPSRVPPPRPPPPTLPPASMAQQSLPPPLERHHPEPQAEQNWRCTACTFENHPFLDKCEICEMPRMTAASGAKGYG